jgi:uncharacterized protein (TIGR00730 family)
MNVSEDFKQTARDMGKILAENKITLVYGGGKSGLMGIIADSVMDNGGKVIGIIPTHISDREIQHKGLTELHVVDSMHIRKQMMVDMSDAFVVLPGGIGTLDEMCEIMTWRQLGIHDKPIIIVDKNNYWTPFLNMRDHIIKEGFMREPDLKLTLTVREPQEVLKAIHQSPEEAFDPSTKWI